MEKNMDSTTGVVVDDEEVRRRDPCELSYWEEVEPLERHMGGGDIIEAWIDARKRVIPVTPRVERGTLLKRRINGGSGEEDPLMKKLRRGGRLDGRGEVARSLEEVLRGQKLEAIGV